MSENALIPSLISAVIISVINIATAIAIGALVFSGPLTPYLSMGVGLFLVGTLTGGVLVPLLTGYKGLVSSPRGGQAPIFAALAAGIVAAMAGQPLENTAVTVVVAFLAITFVIGLAMYLLGQGRIGTLARYIPYPVMGGFFAGLGYLLSRGGSLVAVGQHADVTAPMSFLSTTAMMHLAPAIIFAVVLLIAERRIHHWMLIPSLIGVAMAAFYSWVFMSGISLAAATEMGWLPRYTETTGGFFPVISFSQLALVDWWVILAQSGTMAVLAFLSIVMLLLDASAVEIATNRDLDPNRELKGAGISNMIGALLSGPLAFHSSADTALAYRLGGRGTMMIACYGVILLCAIFLGTSGVTYVPSFLLGGFLIYLGLGFLVTWLWEARRKLPLGDMLVVIFILFFVARYGILEGVAAGLVLATVLFVHRYSRISIVRAEKSGGEHVSNIDRSREHQAFLDDRASSKQIYILQGYLFFGSASKLVEQIRALLDGGQRPELTYLLLDFRRVDAVDTSAINSFLQLIQACHREQVQLVMTGCSVAVLSQLDDALKDPKNGAAAAKFFASLDEGVGWCDDELLLQCPTSEQREVPDAAAVLADMLSDKKSAKALAGSFDRIELAEGDRLFEQGDEGDALYLIARGSVAIILGQPNGATLTVRTMRAGSVLGEMSLYTGGPRTAAAEARADCVLYRLSVQAYQDLAEAKPAAFSPFHRFVVQLLSERLRRANLELLALSR